MAQRRSPRGKSAGKTSKARPKAAKRAAKAKARKPLKVSKAPAKPRRVAKPAKGNVAKPAKARAAKPAKGNVAKPAKARAAKPAKGNVAKPANLSSRENRAPVERRRQRGPKGRRAPAFERAPTLGAETGDDDYAYERDTRGTARAAGETNDTYTPGNLVPGQVGEARPARPNGGRRAVAHPRDSETESVTVESGAEATRSKGGFDEGDGGRRESEIAGAQARDGAGTQDQASEELAPEKQDYGRPKTSGGKAGE